jgi:hypothetical protein
MSDAIPLGSSDNVLSQIPTTKFNALPTAFRYCTAVNNQLSDQLVYNQNDIQQSLTVNFNFTAFNTAVQCFLGHIFNNKECLRDIKSICGTNYYSYVQQCIWNELYSVVLYINTIQQTNATGSAYATSLLPDMTVGSYRLMNYFINNVCTFFNDYRGSSFSIECTVNITGAQVLSAAATFNIPTTYFVTTSDLELNNSMSAVLKIVKRYFPEFDYEPRFITIGEFYDTRLGNLISTGTSGSNITMSNLLLPGIIDRQDVAFNALYFPTAGILQDVNGLTIYSYNVLNINVSDFAINYMEIWFGVSKPLGSSPSYTYYDSEVDITVATTPNIPEGSFGSRPGIGGGRFRSS